MSNNTQTLKGEITNTCTCFQYDEETGEYTDEPVSYCYGDCWNDSVADFSEVTREFRETNETDWWKVTDLRLWNGDVSGYFHADKVEEMLYGMAVRGEWIMRYEVFADRIEYSLSHHDAMGSNTTLTAISEEEREELGLY
jgi:hypothetical protein